VKKGELAVRLDERSGGFSYVQPGGVRGGREPSELAPAPSWNRVAYRR
jgi:hypothetical protein